MAKIVKIQPTTLTDIAEAIREKTETTELIPTVEMAQRIRDIETLPTDATATEEDLLAGKVAYNNDGRFVGIVEDFNGAFEGGETSTVEKAFYVPLLLTRTIENPPLSVLEEIGDSAFNWCESLTNAEIREPIKRIGAYAFSNCSKLSNLIISDSVEKIGESAFEHCNSLTTVTLPGSIKNMSESTFWHCENLETIEILEGTKFTSNYFCYGCTSLKNVILPTFMYSIGDYSFYNTLITNISLSDNLRAIGKYAFSNCINLSNIEIPAKVTNIGYNPFSGCINLTSINVLEDNTVYDSRNNCNAIIETETNRLIAGCKNTTIPNSVTESGESAFCGCTGLTSITIPNSVTSIGKGAFFGCSNLKTIIIQNPDGEIGDNAIPEGVEVIIEK